MKHTKSEMEAHRLMTKEIVATTDFSDSKIRESANKIILLAEQIKAERMNLLLDNL